MRSSLKFNLLQYGLQSSVLLLGYVFILQPIEFFFPALIYAHCTTLPYAITVTAVVALVSVPVSVL